MTKFCLGSCNGMILTCHELYTNMSIVWRSLLQIGALIHTSR